MQIPVTHSILRTLAYFELFSYPLTMQEIRFFLEQETDEDQFQSALLQLLQEHRLFNHGGYFSLQDQPATVTIRKENNRRADKLLITAHRVANFLHRFPFVTGVCISGSLSKQVANKQADIDLFIITQPGKLWIARTFMHLFKKLSFLLGKQHWFCMNYYLDESAFVIREQNFFTAIEMLTLLPVCGVATLERFFRANSWVQDYFPSYAQKQLKQEKRKRLLLRRMIEGCFNNRAGVALDNYLMRLTTARWKQKEANRQLNMKGNRIGLDTGKHFCKPNPKYFQEPLLQRYQKRLSEVLDQQYEMVS